MHFVYLDKAPRLTWQAAFRDASMDGKHGSRPLAVRQNDTNSSTADTMAWKIDGNHVVPVNDLREHSLAGCWCCPADDDGVVVHNSLDGREQFERGERKMS
jgi:hypothetical protein